MKVHERVTAVEGIVGHVFADRALVERAITHPSAVENHATSDSYERLEFLGDSVLGMIVATELYERFPSLDEGELTRLKIYLVSGGTLSEVAGSLGLAELIVMGESEKGTGARGMHSALENVYESLVAALFLDAGFDAARAFVAETLHDYLTDALERKPLDPKSRLQDLSQHRLHQMPEYKICGQAGPAHSPTFTCVVLLDGARVGRGEGPSKKAAEAAAALDALSRIDAPKGADAGSGDADPRDA